MKTSELARILTTFSEIEDILGEVSDTYRNEKNFQAEQYADIIKINMALIDVNKMVIDHYLNH